MEWLRRKDRYGTAPAAYRRPPNPLYLDGSWSWRTATQHDESGVLSRLPVGSEVTVEAVPEPANPYDATAVALYLDGTRVGCLFRTESRTLFRAITAANRKGYHVLMHAKRIGPVGGVGHAVGEPLLEVRASLAADLELWLSQSPQDRGPHFFELDWTITDYQDFYQDRLRAVLGEHDSYIVECSFSTGPRLVNPYSDPSVRAPLDGTYADVRVRGLHIGELRTSRQRRSDDVINQIFSSHHRQGMARLRQWPTNIELGVCVADAQGYLPEFSGPFLWRAERREARRARLEATWAARDAEQVDGQSLAHCRAKVADLKRVGDLDGAIALALKMVDAAEQSAALENRAPRAWVTLEAAIILRKFKDTQGEVAVLERYLQHCPPGQSDAKITERLDKLR